ncbi:hypothetical protein FHS42_005124 [Streptomyces zagrosensis]|uniref:Uncharacterized protein n=1 Tax=Streptomyces zagrosensis TaxID=1042984 RepID=A0A7W9V0D5_9ACTN|nr:hypothetical protein [Streptomyces zagrosensis]
MPDRCLHSTGSVPGRFLTYRLGLLRPMPLRPMPLRLSLLGA